MKKAKHSPSIRKPGDYVQNLSQLATALAVSRQRVVYWKATPESPKPTSDGRHSISAWRQFLATHGRDESPDLRTERIRLLRAQSARIERENRERDGQLVEARAIAAAATPTLTAIRDLLYQKLESEMPIATAGVDVATARIIGRRVADELLRKWQELFRAWSV